MSWFPFILFPAIGAIIGAVTNQIAIRMLFRPYQPIRLGRWRLPFTPGVIPSRRRIIAANIAETFEANLLSGREIHTIITGPKARAVMDTKVDSMFNKLGPLAGLLTGVKSQITDKILDGIEQIVSDAIAHGGALNIRHRLEERINAMPIEQLEELILGFSQRQFRYITLFGGLLGGLIGLLQAVVSLTIQIN